jgi:hypothetical protein
MMSSQSHGESLTAPAQKNTMQWQYGSSQGSRLSDVDQCCHLQTSSQSVFVPVQQLQSLRPVCCLEIAVQPL